MKKKVIVSMGCIMITLVACILWYSMREVKPLENVNVAELGKMTVAYNGEWIEMVQQGDMKAVMEALGQMRLRRAIPMDYDGFNAIIDLYDKDGNIDKIVIRGDYIIINENYYKSERDYSADFRKVANNIAKKPTTIRHKS